ncbi:MAG TPA: hypothetical protein VG034_07425 [Acidimicrobiia bacterium]|jgi:hypothetical protein|nr:hypothetical protein [Acidimicrobiia bacterium]
MVTPPARAILVAVALVTMAGVTTVARAVPAAPPPPAPFRVGLIGDTGYNAEGQANFLRVRDSANAAGLSFVVHDGDIWMGGTYCNDERLRRVKAEFNGFRTLIYTPGDNEWVDCPLGPAGRLEAIRRVFFSQPMSLGAQPIQQRRQAEVPENARWEWGGVVFATLNVPGPSGGGPTVWADIAWLDKTFDRAQEIKAPAVMVMWQDDPVDGSSPQLVARLRKRAAAFGKPVMLVHGDTHHYKLDNPWKDTPNLTRLETFPTFTPEWVKVVVNPAGPAVFTVVRMRA